MLQARVRELKVLSRDGTTEEVQQATVQNHTELQVQELQVLTQQEFSKVEKVQERWVMKELLSKTLKLLK